MQELLQEISQRTGKDNTEVLSEAKKMQERFGGLLTQQGAVELLARKAGVPSAPKPEPALQTFSSAQAGGRMSAIVKVLQVYAPKEFEKEGRKGRVCNVIVTDGNVRGTLVLWDKDVDLVENGKIERNQCLRVLDAKVKTASPLEMHSNMLTEISHADAAIQWQDKPLLTLSQLALDMNDVDFYARVTDIREEKEFETTVLRKGALGPEKRVGKMASIEASDGTTTLRVVLWDKNAEQTRRLRVGDSVKIEGGQVKKNSMSGGLEVHVGWNARLIANPANAPIESRETFLEKVFPRKQLDEIADGDVALVTAKLESVKDAKTIVKCAKCNATMRDVKCENCGSETTRSLPIVNVKVAQGLVTLTAVFYGKQALDLLDIKQQAVDLATIADLKRDEMIGKELTLVVQGKHSSFSNELELVAKHVL